MDDWEKAGKLAAEARMYAKEVCKVGKTYTEVVDSVEDFIKKKGGLPAFPMDLSVNSMAAHYCPFLDDDNVLKKGDVVKLDIGVHINGYVADNACTVELGTSKWNELIRNSEDACKAGCEAAIPDAPIRNVGKIIQETIENAGFTSIVNLSGHGVERWKVHTTPTIPNFDNKNETKLKNGQYIAIEPFPTTGIGKVGEGKPSGVYGLVGIKPIRLSPARKLMEKIKNDYNTLPFTERWLKGVKNTKFLLKLLEKEGVIQQYNQLPEKSGGMVAQYENTLKVGEGIITKV
tara:strand:- start:5588 stop:6454 length:867 start_codon:yes stop_codon:yes gene_type:complete